MRIRIFDMVQYHICRKQRDYEQKIIYWENENTRATDTTTMGRGKCKM